MDTGTGDGRWLQRVSLNLPPLVDSYERYLDLRHLRPATKKSYLKVLERYWVWCMENEAPWQERRAIEDWLRSLNDLTACTERNYLVYLRRFFKWAMEEDEIEADPTARIPLPVIDEPQKDVLTGPQIAAALAKMEKAKEWRDMAIISVLFDTGIRSAELLAAKVTDIDWNYGKERDMGPLVALNLPSENTKGRRFRVVHLSNATVRVLERYLRKRADGKEWLFLGRKGDQMSSTGLYTLVRRVFADTGRVISPHDLRHSSASAVARDMSESDMMHAYGWRSTQMVHRYTKQVAGDNALLAHVKHGPMTKLGG